MSDSLMPFQPEMDEPHGDVLLLAAEIGEPQVYKLGFFFFDQIQRISGRHDRVSRSG